MITIFVNAETNKQTNKRSKSNHKPIKIDFQPFDDRKRRNEWSGK